MRFYTRPIFTFLLTLLYSIPRASTQPLSPVADVCLVIDTVYENITKSNKGYNALRPFLIHHIIRDLEFAPNTTYGLGQVDQGLRFAIVKLDHTEQYTVLKNLTPTRSAGDRLPDGPFGINDKFANDDSNDPGKKHQNQNRKTARVNSISDIRKDIFEATKGDRTAPDVLIYFYLADKFDAALHSKVLDDKPDLAVFAVSYDEQKGRAFYGDPANNKFFYFVPSENADSSNFPFVRAIEEVLKKCTGSNVTYSDCYYMPDPEFPGDYVCVKHEIYKYTGTDLFCWNGPTDRYHFCDYFDCQKTCEKFGQKTTACDAVCGKVGIETVVPTSHDKSTYGQHCHKYDTPCVVSCSGSENGDVVPAPVTTDDVPQPPDEQSGKVPEGSPDPQQDKTAETTEQVDAADITEPQKQASTRRSTTSRKTLKGPTAGLPKWKIAAIGGGVGGGVLLIAVIILIVCLTSKKKPKRKRKGARTSPRRGSSAPGGRRSRASSSASRPMPPRGQRRSESRGGSRGGSRTQGQHGSRGQGTRSRPSVGGGRASVPRSRQSGQQGGHRRAADQSSVRR